MVRRIRGAGKSLSNCTRLVVAVTAISAVLVFYTWVFHLFQSKFTAGGLLSTSSTGNLLRDTADTITHRIKSFGGVLSGSNNVPLTTEVLDRIKVDYNDNPDPIVKSHFGMVYGIEPFERPGMKHWDLHTIPTDDWYNRAKMVTDMCDLELHEGIQGAENGLEDKVVWVSGLFDLKRGENGGDFKRPMKEYYDRFNRVLARGFEMVIFIPPQFEEHLNIDKSRVKVIHMHGSDLEWFFPYFDRVEAIRNSKLYKDQAHATGWLEQAPQSLLRGYNPLVMSKLRLVQEAARLNPWGARYHMWMDAGHLCAGEQNPKEQSMYRKMMASGMFVTHWPYGTTTEVHGLTDKAMHMYLGTAEDPLQIVRGGIFGGTLPYIECVLKAYTIALHQTLTDGYIGTEECIWAIIYGRLPHLFKAFDNNSLGNHGDNCASFVKNNMEAKEIKAGSRDEFYSPPVPKYPSWWSASNGPLYKPQGPKPAQPTSIQELVEYNKKTAPQFVDGVGGVVSLSR